MVCTALFTVELKPVFPGRNQYLRRNHNSMRQRWMTRFSHGQLLSQLANNTQTSGLYNRLFVLVLTGLRVGGSSSVRVHSSETQVCLMVKFHWGFPNREVLCWVCPVISSSALWEWAAQLHEAVRLWAKEEPDGPIQERSRIQKNLLVMNLFYKWPSILLTAMLFLQFAWTGKHSLFSTFGCIRTRSDTLFRVNWNPISSGIWTQGQMPGNLKQVLMCLSGSLLLKGS